MIDEQERTRMDIEELEREQGVLLPDRIEMRRHKRRRRHRGPTEWTSYECPYLGPGEPPPNWHPSLIFVPVGARNPAAYC